MTYPGKFGEVCHHETLMRACEICELDERVRSLESRLQDKQHELEECDKYVKDQYASYESQLQAADELAEAGRVLNILETSMWGPSGSQEYLDWVEALTAYDNARGAK